MGDLNRGLGAGDPDVRLPPQQLRIEIPRFVETVIVHDSAAGLHSGGPSLRGFDTRQPLAGHGLLARVRQAVQNVASRFKG